jgi:hypothetical protein
MRDKRRRWGRWWTPKPIMRGFWADSTLGRARAIKRRLARPSSKWSRPVYGSARRRSARASSMAGSFRLDFRLPSDPWHEPARSLGASRHSTNEPPVLHRGLGPRLVLVPRGRGHPVGHRGGGLCPDARRSRGPDATRRVAKQWNHRTHERRPEGRLSRGPLVGLGAEPAQQVRQSAASG